VLAVIIAPGIASTFTLSLAECARELGLLRAIGTRRGQLGQMIAVKSVIIVVIRAVLGSALSLGATLAAALTRSQFTVVILGTPARTQRSWLSRSVGVPGSPRGRPPTRPPPDPRAEHAEVAHRMDTPLRPERAMAYSAQEGKLPELDRRHRDRAAVHRMAESAARSPPRNG